MATEDFSLFGDAGAAIHGERKIPMVYWMLGVADPDAWRRTTTDDPDAAPPSAPNRSPHFAPHVGSTLRPAIAGLTIAALDRFAAA